MSYVVGTGKTVKTKELKISLIFSDYVNQTTLTYCYLNKRWFDTYQYAFVWNICSKQQQNEEKPEGMIVKTMLKLLRIKLLCGARIIKRYNVVNQLKKLSLLKGSSIFYLYNKALHSTKLLTWAVKALEIQRSQFLFSLNMFTPIALNVNYFNSFSLKILMINASKPTITIMVKHPQNVFKRSFISAKQSFASEVRVVCFFLNFNFCSFTASKHGSQSWNIERNDVKLTCDNRHIGFILINVLIIFIYVIVFYWIKRWNL